MYSHHIENWGCSYDEWYAAAVDAINIAKAAGGQKMGQFGFISHSAAYYDELLIKAAEVVGATAELGDNSTPTTLLTGVAVVSAAGIVLARRKRAAC